MLKQAILLVALAMILLPLAVSPNSPLPPPGHWFNVEGFVVPSDGGLAADYTVVLMGRGGSCRSLVEWTRLGSGCVEPGYEPSVQDIVITRDNGRYWLSVFSCCDPSSLVVAVVLPDTTILSAVILSRDLDGFPIEKSYSYDESGFLCDDTVSGSYVGWYSYDDVDSLDIPVP